ncbi:threonine-phosphate decarboxylase CobD [Hyphomicrobium sp. CS1GBMeth3]|uniref:threonine-phosphate decarboxylase CobD n=1 Tax=Hyphomicrobium sp. CS1GBMeth3 TaxID=1892845 RepID=UPI0009317282|nr:threonine-phosphate decarboxylase CobD [Hyphomicrobium sp. CS1GBMeth3]
MTSARFDPIFHGGDLDTVRAVYPGAPEPWIDLSTGINPCAYSLPLIDERAWARLPQRSDQDRLVEVAARRYGARSPEMVVSAPGTQALIQILPRLVPPTHVAIVSPTYAEHAAAWRREGHEVFDIQDVDAARGARVVVVVNPNNPTGRLYPPERVHSLAAELAARDGFLVVDEAFIDVLPREASIVPDLPPATVVLRSFGKTYGLAGLRLGFAIAAADMADRLRETFGPWAVAGPALTIGAAALADDRWLRETRTRLETDSRRLDAILTASGCEVLGGTPLFRLARHPAAARVVDALGRGGIHVRRFTDWPTWLRFGLPGTNDAWQRLERALLEAARA